MRSPARATRKRRDVRPCLVTGRAVSFYGTDSQRDGVTVRAKPMKRAMNAINRQFLIVSCPQRAASADDFRVAETPLVLLVPLVRSARGIM